MAHHTAKPVKSGVGNSAGVKAAPVLDTVPCIFYALMSDKHTALVWKRGHIVLEDKKIVIGQGTFSCTEAASLTGVIRNTFLSPDKKKTFKKQVIKVVLL
ncbi:hypothetical protein MUY27_08320 [Mucilaginibacter sp. RS28]|uniref:Uncharacterized protein n=1 Tax=Mucilaginibacter straminoryzae TaxID=2932774 RepID=A0A9X1X2L3_9SPHI|nr:hypothetical protein [Mucilaginibacter straminoryzae]MCJ8209711.1 hypothetical protein [Mucilaginibacter straminoryzae]